MLEIGGVVDEASLLPRRDERGMAQFLQMKRQRRGWYREPLAEVARGKPLRTGLHQQTERGQARFLGERREGRYSGFCFHFSIIVEI